MKLLRSAPLLAAVATTPALAQAGVSIAGASLTDAIALIAVVVSTAALIRTRVSEAKQSKIQEATFIREYNDGVQAWGNEAIEKLTEAAFLCEVDPTRLPKGEFYERRRLLKVALSALTVNLLAATLRPATPRLPSSS